MTHVITQNCCNDASCVSVCPVNCIHPTPEEREYLASEILYIDPDTCIDCGACVDVCPVGAISPDFDLPVSDSFFVDLNAAYYADPAHQGYDTTPAKKTRQTLAAAEPGPLRVAVVGSGPSAAYAVEALMSRRGIAVEVTMFERLPAPWGLARYGVAPDHQATKSVTTAFLTTARRKGVQLWLNVEIGTHIELGELLRFHHAVIYAGGAPHDRRMGIPGEDLPGSHAATDFVAWYNGHPDAAHLEFNLNTDRAVIVGNGNVALDVARILATPVDSLAKTDIATHALEALAESKVQEIVVLGRRGPREAAFTTPELFGLTQSDSYTVSVDTTGLPADWARNLGDESVPLDAAKHELLARLAANSSTSAKPVIRLQFLGTPTAVLGDDSVRALRVGRNTLVFDGGLPAAQPTGEEFEVDCGLVLRSIGYRGSAVPGLPFDPKTSTVPNENGRVVDPASADAGPGMYVAGWIKRGPSGVIGTNKKCSEDTVKALIEDYVAGRLQAPTADAADLEQLVHERQPDVLDLDDWRRIDKYERDLGREKLRVRVKLVSKEELLRVARSEAP